MVLPQDKLLYRSTGFTEGWENEPTPGHVTGLGISSEISLYEGGLSKNVYLLVQESHNRNTNTVTRDIIGLTPEIAAGVLPFIEQLARQQDEAE